MAKQIKKATHPIRNFRSAVTAGNSPDKEKFTLPSLTVPDQSMSVRVILAKYGSGTLGDISNNNLEFSEDMPDYRGLDLSQVMEMRTNAVENVQYLENEIAVRQHNEHVQKLLEKKPVGVNNENTTES